MVKIYRWPLRIPTSLQPTHWPVKDSILVTFGRMFRQTLLWTRVFWIIAQLVNIEVVIARIEFNASRLICVLKQQNKVQLQLRIFQFLITS